MTYYFREDKYSTFKKILRAIFYFIAGCVLTIYWLSATSLEEEDEDDNIVYLEFDCSTINETDNVPFQIAEECAKKLLKDKK